MSEIKWDDVGKRLYETGTSKAVLYLKDEDGEYPEGVAWNGITAVSEKPTGADVEKLYADDTKYLELRAVEEFEYTIEAYTYPDKWMECDGSKEVASLGLIIGQQERKHFGFCYRTAIGNDVDGSDHGYKLHLIYDSSASPSERGYQTMNDSPEAITFSWDVSSTAVPMTGYKNVSILTVDSTKATETGLAALEAALYGTVADEPYLPLPDEVKSLLATTPPPGGGEEEDDEDGNGNGEDENAA